MEAPVERVVVFRLALRAHTHIRRNRDEFTWIRLRIQNFEFCKVIGGAGFRFERINPRERWWSLCQVVQEGLQAILTPVYLDLHTAGGIAYPSGQLVAHRETVDKGSKTDSLDDPAYPNLQPGLFVHHTCRGAAILERSQLAQTSMPSPVLHETAKVVSPGLSISTPWRKYSMRKSIYGSKSVLLIINTSSPR